MIEKIHLVPYGWIWPITWLTGKVHPDMCGDARSQQNPQSVGATYSHHHRKCQFLFLYSDSW